ncbi:MAG: hypothetical protein H0U53_09230 [Actinobacteria bacterium]|nr:hypothetical protein [Actinomycetota bacterium]
MPNHKEMRRIVGTLVAAGLLLGALPAHGAITAPAAANNFIFAGGGTPVSNGIFFPGTTFCDTQGCTGVPMQVPRGDDITFVNLDTSSVTNAHQIVSRKRKRGRPLFISEVNYGPGQGLVVTSHLKPGVYKYYCSFHFGMFGQIEITD